MIERVEGTHSALSTQHSALKTRRLRVHAALIAVAALFSANYIISKIGMRAFAPLTFAYLRVAGSALLLMLFAPRGLEPLSRQDRWRVAGFSMLGVVGNQVLFLGGLALTSAHIA